MICTGDDTGWFGWEAGWYPAAVDSCWPTACIAWELDCVMTILVAVGTGGLGTAPNSGAEVIVDGRDGVNV